MKKTLKYIILLFLLLIVFAPNVFAMSKETGYVDIEASETLYFDDISFYLKNIYEEEQGFGVVSMIKNNTQGEVRYKIETTYYDSNYNVILNDSNNGVALAGTDYYNIIRPTSDFLDMIDEIKYFKTKITINESLDNIITPSLDSKYSNLEYVIDKYDIDIKVNKDNSFDITETITAYFNASKHGIYRSIPIKNKLSRTDGTESVNHARISNIEVNDKFTTSKEGSFYKIKIGSEDKTLTKEQTYIIKYNYNIGKDPLKDIDELYYNIIGTEWDTVIGNVSFKITMPEEFDATKIGFSHGKIGTVNSDNINYSVDGNIVTGSYNGILNANEALTIRVELPEGYFSEAGLKIDYKIYLMFLIPILSLVIAVFLWIKYGKDEEIVETVEFNPPKEFNSLEVGFLYNGEAKEKDVTSLLIYLANKGYVKISEVDTSSMFSKTKDFKITKLKEYDGNNYTEQLFLKRLFNPNFLEDSYTQEMTEVSSIDLKDRFFIAIDEILANVNTRENKDKIMENTKGKSKLIVFLMILSLLTTVTILTIDYGTTSELFITLLVVAFLTPFYLVGILVKGMPVLFRTIWLSFVLIFSGFLFTTFPAFDAIKSEKIYLIGFILTIIEVGGMAICHRNMGKRTKYGNEILGKLKGFKTFLETVEKEKLETLVSQDPNYFYNILPYTYVLGVSDVWIKKFEAIAIPKPVWYSGNSSFNINDFGDLMDKTINSLNSVSHSSSGSSGSSSGGGSSGGGSGGGGGGSW